MVDSYENYKYRLLLSLMFSKSTKPDRALSCLLGHQCVYWFVATCRLVYASPRVLSESSAIFFVYTSASLSDSNLSSILCCSEYVPTSLPVLLLVKFPHKLWFPLSLSKTSSLLTLSSHSTLNNFLQQHIPNTSSLHFFSCYDTLYIVNAFEIIISWWKRIRASKLRKVCNYLFN